MSFTDVEDIDMPSGTACVSLDLNSAIASSQQNSQEAKPNNLTTGKKLVEIDGEIGFQKGQTFVPMTNFVVRCIGYVVDDSTSTSALGFLFHVNPKDRVLCDIEEPDEDIFSPSG